MTPRKACVLTDQLPQGARTWLALGLDYGWTNTDHLLAYVGDSLNIANWQRQGDAKAKRPEPIMRPSGVAEVAAAEDRLLAKAKRFRERTTRTEKPDGD